MRWLAGVLGLVAWWGTWATGGRAEEDGQKKIVLIAGSKSHGYGSHGHYPGCMLLADSLQQNLPNVKCVVMRDGFPKDAAVFEHCDAVVIFSDGGGGHPFLKHLQELDALAEKRVGIACLHYAVEIPKGEPGDYLLKWIGGYFETHWSVNPTWTADFQTIPQHPVTRGVNPFKMEDEWYYHMRFRERMEGVVPVLSALPPKETLNRPDGPHSNNPGVRAAVLERKEPQHLAWVSERPNGQRGFGFTGGHWHWNWAEPNFRKLVLNGIFWVAHGEVPAAGVVDKQPTMKDLERNQDYEPPAGFDRAGTLRRFKLSD